MFHKYSIEYFWIGLENLTTQTLTYPTVNIDTDTAQKLHENGCPKMFWEFSMLGRRLIEKICISTPPGWDLTFLSCAQELAESICPHTRFQKQRSRCRSSLGHVRFS